MLPRSFESLSEKDTANSCSNPAVPWCAANVVNSRSTPPYILPAHRCRTRIVGAHLLRRPHPVGELQVARQLNGFHAAQDMFIHGDAALGHRAVAELIASAGSAGQRQAVA